MDFAEDIGKTADSRRFRGYTREEMTAAATLSRAEDPRWRWLFPVTRSARDFSNSHFLVLQAAYAMGIALVYSAARADHGGESRPMTPWLVMGLLSFALRTVIYGSIIRSSPEEVARNATLRLAPLAIMAVGVAYWTWTATIFVGPTLSFTTLVALLTFVLLSVACISMIPSSPAACATYLLALWLTMTYELTQADWIGGTNLAILLVALASILSLTFSTGLTAVRRYLVRSDDVDLLVGELRERNEEIERLHRLAASELADRSMFFASASHDFRQRVHAMKLLSHLCVQDVKSQGPEDTPLARLARVVEDLESYMTDVLEFARWGERSSNPERTQVSLQHVFQRVEVAFEDVAASRGIDLRVRTTHSTLLTDPAMLVRILENLVSNAVRFSQDKVLLTARRRGGEIHIEVRDTGKGIPSNSVAKIFDAFYQVPTNGHDADRGVGLGLAIVKRLAGALGYRIEVVSRSGSGTMMRLIVPNQDVLT